MASGKSEAIQSYREVPSTLDLNQLKETITAFNNNWTNYPGSKPMGTVIEEWNPHNFAGMQKFIPFQTNKVYYREYTNSTWTGWRKMMSATVADYDVTSESALKTRLLEVANAIEANQAAFVRYGLSFDSTEFIDGWGTYCGTLYKITGTIFTALLTSETGKCVSIGYNGGTWNSNKIA